jgi:hypothetical protein
MVHGFHSELLRYQRVLLDWGYSMGLWDGGGFKKNGGRDFLGFYIWFIYDLHMAMDQYLLIAFLVGWISINPSYDLGFTRYQGFDPSPYDFIYIIIYSVEKKQIYPLLISIHVWIIWEMYKNYINMDHRYMPNNVSYSGYHDSYDIIHPFP